MGLLLSSPADLVSEDAGQRIDADGREPVSWRSTGHFRELAHGAGHVHNAPIAVVYHERDETL
jgi:hypothetical protein